jgi:TonB family protein
MLQPLQLEELSARYPEEIDELRHFLAKAGLPLDSADSLANVAARLHNDRTFRRDLTSHVLVLNHATGYPIGYPALLGILALAAAGPHFAVTADDTDAHALLRFLMEARRSFDLPSPLPRPVAPELFTRHDAAEDVPRSRRPVLWATAAASLLLVASLIGLSLHHPSTPSHNTAPVITAEAPEPAAPAPAAPAHEPHPPTAAPILHAKPAAGTLADSIPAPAPANPTSAHPTRTHRPSAQHNTLAADLNPAPIVRRRAPATPSANNDLSALVPKVQPVTIPSNAPNARTTALPHAPLVRPTSLGVMAANVTYSPAPAYPPAASAAHVQGEVKLEAEVDPEGNVASARVISGPPLLREAAVNAVEQWRYRPYIAEGKPIYTNTQIVMDFQLP